MKDRAKQPNKALLRRRVEDIAQIRLDGASVWECCAFVREKEQEEGSAWQLTEGEKPLSDASVRRYLRLADRLMDQDFGASRKRLRRRHLAQRRNLFAKAVSQGDVRAALACLRDEAELLGLYPNAEAKLAKEVEELKRLLAEAEARRGRKGDGDGGAEGADSILEGADRGAVGAAGGTAGPAAGRPDAGDDGGGVRPRPLASGGLAPLSEEGPTPLFPAER
jgi:hypothetical protein